MKNGTKIAAVVIDWLWIKIMNLWNGNLLGIKNIEAYRNLKKSYW